MASVVNQRSFVYVGNLVDALVCSAIHPDSAGQIYLVSDGEDISTPGLIRQLAAALGTSPHLFHLPPGVIRLGGAMLGKSGVNKRLLGTLRVNSSKITRELSWVPPFTMEQGLIETAKWYRGGE